MSIGAAANEPRAVGSRSAFKERFEPRPLLNKTRAALLSLLLSEVKLCEQRT